MKQATFTTSIICIYLLLTSNAFSQNYWETIIPEPWTKFVQPNYRFLNQYFDNANNRTGSTPFTGNVVVPPYVIERVEGDDSDAIMMITKISGGFHGGGWIVKVNRRSGYSEQLEVGGGPNTNDNFYGAFYNADIDTLRLPQSIKEIGSLAFENGKVKVLICGSITPPKLSLNAFGDADMHVLIVPTGCMKAYQEAEYWNVFKEIKEGAEKYMYAQLTEKDGAWYQLAEDETATMINSDNAYNLVIPNEVSFNNKYYPVTTLGPASINRYKLKSITLGTNIKHFAPSHIQTSHFRSDSYSWETSKNTVKLQEIHVSPDNSVYSEVNGGLYTKDGTALVYLPYVCENVISGLSSERYYTIPDGVTTIKKNAFPKYFAYNYSRSVNAGIVAIPPSVTRIEEQDVMYGFHFKFTSETPPEITGFGSACKSAFYVPQGCLYTYLDKYGSLKVYESSDKANIIKLYMSDKVLYWNSSERCYDLNYLVTDQSDVLLPSFASYGLMEGDIKTVGKYGYLKYTNFSLKTSNTLRSLTIPEGVEEIYLKGFNTLQTAILPNTLKVIGPYCFRGSKYLENVEIKGNLEIIHNYAFAECEKMKEIALPAKLTHIGDEAFEGCTALSTVRMEAPIPPSIFHSFNDWGEYPNVPYSFVFSYPAKEATLYVPANSKNLYSEYPVWKEFGRIVPVGESDNPDAAGISTINIQEVDDVYYTLDGRKIEGKPTTKGIYVLNGCKVVVK